MKHSVQRCLLLICILFSSLAFSSLTVEAQGRQVSLTLPASLNFAVSPSPIGSGARAQGKGVAFIAVADDATAASHNPAGLIQLETLQFSLVGTYLLSFEQQDVTRSDLIVENNTLDGFDLDYLSVTYPFELLRRNVVLSLNYQRLFDLRGAVNVTSPFDPEQCKCTGLQRVSSRQSGSLFSISPAIAVQMTPALSFGVAFNIWPNLFDNGWKQQTRVESEGGLIAFGNGTAPFTSTGHIEEEFDFKGFNVTVGFLWRLWSSGQRQVTLGGVFRSPFTAKVKHTHRSELEISITTDSGVVPQRETPPLETNTLDMDMPMSYGLGLSTRLSDHWTLSLDVSRVHWSDFKLEASNLANPLLVEDATPSGKGRAVLNGQGDDTTSVRLGAEYLWDRPTVQIPLRAGMFYDPEPGNEGTDEFYGLSFGVGLVTGRLKLDIAYVFRAGTVRGEATDTDVYQHRLFGSVIYRF